MAPGGEARKPWNLNDSTRDKTARDNTLAKFITERMPGNPAPL
jgi:hypothetical protein